MKKINPTSAVEPGIFKIEGHHHFFKYWYKNKYAEIFSEIVISPNVDIGVVIFKNQKWTIPENEPMTEEEIQETYDNIRKALDFLKIKYEIEIG